MKNKRLPTGSIELVGSIGNSVVLVLVIVAIIVVLIAMLLPGVERVREADARTQIINNLKQVCLATQSAHDVWKKLPPASGPFGKVTGNYSLSVHLLPFVEQPQLYQTALEGNKMPTTALIPTYSAPLDISTADWVRVQNFACNLRVFTDAGFKAYDSKSGYINIDETTISPLNTSTSKVEDRFPDGTSNTMMYATRYASSGTTLATDGSGLCSNYDVLAGTAASGSGLLRGHNRDRPAGLDSQHERRLAERPYLGKRQLRSRPRRKGSRKSCHVIWFGRPPSWHGRWQRSPGLDRNLGRDLECRAPTQRRQSPGIRLVK